MVTQDVVPRLRSGGVACIAAHHCEGDARELGERRVTEMVWGYPPSAGVRGPIVNVRNYASPFWRSALANPARRCLVPVTSFSEWSAERNERGKKTLHWFSLPSQPIFSLAGIWRPTDAGPRYAFLRTGYEDDASAYIVGNVHPKACPVILHRDDEETWLSAPLEQALRLAIAFPSHLMAVDLVGR